MQRIHDRAAKIKAGLDAVAGEWGAFALVTLIALSSFGLGRLSAFEDGRPLIRLSEAPAAPRPIAPGGQIVASHGGQAYYFPWCAGAEKIAAGNRRWFSSEAAAKAAGYRPAKNCKGLNSN